MGAGEVAALAGREEWRPRFAIGVGGGESEVRDKENTSEFRGERRHMVDGSMKDQMSNS